MSFNKRALYGAHLYVPNDVMTKLKFALRLDQDFKEIEAKPVAGAEWTRLAITLRGRPASDAPMVGKRVIAKNQSLRPQGGIARRARAMCAAWLAASDYKAPRFDTDAGRVVHAEEVVKQRLAEYLAMAEGVSPSGAWELPYAKRVARAIDAPAPEEFAHGGVRPGRYYRIVHDSGLELIVSAKSRYGWYLNQNNPTFAPPESWSIEEVTSINAIGGASIWTRLNKMSRDAVEIGGHAMAASEVLKRRVAIVCGNVASEEWLKTYRSDCPLPDTGFTIPHRVRVGNKFVVNPGKA